MKRDWHATSTRASADWLRDLEAAVEPEAGRFGRFERVERAERLER